ncbi:hypothetical protein [Ornithinibacillus sp. 179-J 7C1 HS]|uniref:hypothetical protein n=1 Tax=Ornithinibacillus sp. 179-J 7C1 HS TaxID=3142384 RepID=UPI0039A05881
MDKQLKEAKIQFEQIPTSFTEKDKKAIRHKLDQLDSSPKRKVFRFYPNLLTVAVLAAAFLIFIVTINDQTNLFLTNNDSADSSMEMAVEKNSLEGEAGAYESEVSSLDDGLGNSSMNDEAFSGNVFHPDTVKYNSNFPVRNVEEDGDTTIITFEGYQLNGSFLHDTPLSFEPSEESWSQIPIAEGDIDNDIPIYISNEEFVRSAFLLGNEDLKDISIFVSELTYHYSPDGSSIYLKVADSSGLVGISMNVHNESIALSDSLMERYEQYKETLHDNDLKGLTAFEIFKLYHYATYQGDLEVEYALFFNKENHYVPDKDTFLAEANYSEKQAEDFYNAMLELERYEEIFLTEDEVIIRYTLDHTIGFRLYRDKELDVWKVSWMPIQ